MEEKWLYSLCSRPILTDFRCVADVGPLAQLPQFEENGNDFSVLACRKSLIGNERVGSGAM